MGEEARGCLIPKRARYKHPAVAINTRLMRSCSDPGCLCLLGWSKLPDSLAYLRWLQGVSYEFSFTDFICVRVCVCVHTHTHACMSTNLIVHVEARG